MTIVSRSQPEEKLDDSDGWCIHLSIGGNHRSEKVRRLMVRDMSALAEKLEEHPSTADGGAHIVPAPMHPSRRSAANAGPAQIVGLDFDELTQDAAVAVRKVLAAYSALAYETRKSTPDKPRLRVLVEADRPIDHADYKAAHDALVAELSEIAGIELTADPACDKSEQLLFTPLAGRTVELFTGAKFTPPEPVATVASATAAGFMVKGKNRNVNAHKLAGFMRRHGATADEIKQTLQGLPGGLPLREIDSITRSATKYPIEGASHLRIRRLSDVKPEKLLPLWTGRFYRGKISMVFGDMGLGKTTMLFDIAARVTRALEWPDGSGEHAPMGEVLILSTEDGVADTILPRIEVAGGDTSKVHVIEGVASADGQERNLFSLVTHMALLDQTLHDMQGRVLLVIVDPITGVFHGADSHKTAEVRDVLGALADVCERHKACFVGISHPNKAQNQKVDYRMTGSLAFGAAPRSVFIVAKDEQADGDRIVMAQIKNNLAKKQPSLAFCVTGRMHPTAGEIAGITWMGIANETAAELMAPAPTPSQRATEAKEDAAVAWLEKQLRGGLRPAAEIHEQAEQDGITRKYLDKAATQLAIKVKTSTGPWEWRLRTDGDDT